MRGIRVLLVVLLAPGLMAVGQTLYRETFEGTAPPGIPSGWDRTAPPSPDVMGSVCWKVVSIQNLFGENLPSFPSGSRAAYFGRVDLSQGKGDYDVGTVLGELTSPSINLAFPRIKTPDGTEVTPDYAFVEVVFWSLREVEYWPGGEYDKTEVFVDGEPVWKRTSKDKSQRVWEKVTLDPIFKPNSSQLQLQFTFDSVDGYKNRYLGWLIDDVEVRISPLKVQTEVLPRGKVNVPYFAEIILLGGVPWKEDGSYYLRTRVVKGNLPPRINLFRAELDLANERYVALLNGVAPELPGEYEFTLEFEDMRGEKVQRTFIVTVDPADEVGTTGAQVIFTEDFSNGPIISGWSYTGLWHYEDAFEGQDQVMAYFHQATGNYDTGARTFGYLTSPEIDVTQYGGSDVEIGFKSWREVEEYTKGKYDLTFVEVSFDNGPWTRVWEKSSADGPEPQWQDEATEAQTIPLTAKTMRVRFGFDSVDRHNNNYRGWAIDKVEVRVVTGTLEILDIEERVLMAEVGVPFRYQFQARGGVPPYIWSADSRLPRGLKLDRYTGELFGVPEDEGEIEFTVTVTDKNGTGQSASKEFTIFITEKATLFTDSFDNGLGNWIEENLGLWHITTTVPKVNLTNRGSVAYYGQDSTGNYSTGAKTVGYLTSQPFDTNGAQGFKLVFDYWREVEYYAPGGYDQTYVVVRFLTGAKWTNWYCIWYKDSAHTSEKTWTTESVGAYAIPSGATKMQIRFVFDSVDRFYNNYVGWLIDNVKVEMASSGSPLPTTSLEPMTKPRGDFAVLNIPNPVRDVHTTTFVVRGVEADLIRVEVYDLTGRLVYVGEAFGNELVWHTQDLLGRYLANGVYLYKILVKVGDTWIVSNVQKIVILR